MNNTIILKTLKVKKPFTYIYIYNHLLTLETHTLIKVINIFYIPNNKQKNVETRTRPSLLIYSGSHTRAHLRKPSEHVMSHSWTIWRSRLLITKRYHKSLMRAV